MANNNNSPLSIGEFLYDPITSWQKFFNPQITLNYKPTTNEIESHVVERAGSYGKQLGIIIDMISVLKSEIIKNDKNMTKEQKSSVNAFDALASTVKSAVRDYKGGSVKQDVDQFVFRLEKVKEKAPKVYQECMNKLEQSMME
jgi:hypothetical protein